MLQIKQLFQIQLATKTIQLLALQLWQELNRSWQLYYSPTQDLATNTTVAQVVGNKGDTVAGTSLISLCKQILSATYTVGSSYQQKVYPTLSNGISVNASAGAWTLSAAFTQIVPVNTITSDFYITYFHVSTASATDTYELVLYSGTAGNEVEIGRARFYKDGGKETGVFVCPLSTLKIAANSRISAKIASLAGSRTAIVSIYYHT